MNNFTLFGFDLDALGVFQSHDFGSEGDMVYLPS